MNQTFTLEVQQLCKCYGERTVLGIESLTLKSDCSYALVGPNGSGKSTFLKLLAGVDNQTSGYVGVSGEVARNELSVGYMPQKSYVFGFSVARNVALALEGARLPRSVVDERVARALEEVGMSAFADERGSGLSGGEAQRVALARMLVQDLDVLLLDEPTASMDIAGTLLVEEALRSYRERTGCLLVVATHAPSQARRVSDQVVMLASGRVVERGATESVLNTPESSEGREFLSYWTV